MEITTAIIDSTKFAVNLHIGSLYIQIPTWTITLIDIVLFILHWFSFIVILFLIYGLISETRDFLNKKEDAISKSNLSLIMFYVVVLVILIIPSFIFLKLPLKIHRNTVKINNDINIANVLSNKDNLKDYSGDIAVLLKMLTDLQLSYNYIERNNILKEKENEIIKSDNLLSQFKKDLNIANLNLKELQLKIATADKIHQEQLNIIIKELEDTKKYISELYTFKKLNQLFENSIIIKK